MYLGIDLVGGLYEVGEPFMISRGFKKEDGYFNGNDERINIFFVKRYNGFIGKICVENERVNRKECHIEDIEINWLTYGQIRALDKGNEPLSKEIRLFLEDIDITEDYYKMLEQ